MNFKSISKDIFYDCLGGLAYGVGVVCFFNSSNIAPGGVSGISIMLNFLFGAPIGITGLLINVPIIILGYIYLGKTMMNKTLKSILITTFIIDFIITPFFPVYSNDRMLASLFGGLLLGTGLALIFQQGSTTGGTDILSHLIKRKYPHFSIGRAMMIIDSVIISLSTIVFGDIESALFAVIGLFCSTKIIDSLLYGADRGTLVFIISDKNKEISDEIITRMERGATLLYSKGMYSGKQSGVLMCAVRRHEFARLKNLVYSVDFNAFFMVCPAEEIAGEGFTRKLN